MWTSTGCSKSSRTRLGLRSNRAALPYPLPLTPWLPGRARFHRAARAPNPVSPGRAKFPLSRLSSSRSRLPLPGVARSISRLILTGLRPFGPSLKRVSEPVAGHLSSVYCAISDRPIPEPSRPQMFPEILFCGDTSIPTTRVGYYGGTFPANRRKKPLDSELRGRQRCGGINIPTEALSLNQLFGNLPSHLA